MSAYKRPFKDVKSMDATILAKCNQRASEDDIIYHVGDLYCYKKDGNYGGLSVPWSETSKGFNAVILPIEGNHDKNNGVKCVAQSMRLVLGGHFNCVLCHYPSYDPRSRIHLSPGDINICGHVHNLWDTKKYFIDKQNKVLNINVGVDVWGFAPISEAELSNYIAHLMNQLGSIKHP